MLAGEQRWQLLEAALLTVEPLMLSNDAVIEPGQSQGSIGFCASRPSGGSDTAAILSATGY